MTTPSDASPGHDGVTFGRVDRGAEDPPPRPAVDYGPNHDEVAELLRQAAALSPAQARQVASAVAWRWVPLGVPAGSVAAARSAAIAAGRTAGRGPALEAAQAAAREAALSSPGGRETAPRWSWAENALSALVIGVLGAVVSGLGGVAVLALVFGAVALVSGVVLLFLESAYVRRLRLTSAAATAALGLTTRGLIEPGSFELLVGPWRSVVRD